MNINNPISLNKKTIETPMPLVLPFTQISSADLARVGGKGANLGEMTQAGFPVPPGFCVTTAAFQQFMAGCDEAEALYASLAGIAAEDVQRTREVGTAVRHTLSQVAMPTAVSEAVLTSWRVLDENASYAVRSSATAEDLPDASFAGQQDTFLNVRGADAMLEAVRNCWISLFTDRAILYRIQNEFSHRDVMLSVVVQQMVLPGISGILFTADPVSNNRYITSIDASYGLGEALVAGLVSADLYRVDKRTNELVTVQVGDKQMAIRPLPEGGTIHETITGDARTAQVLTTAQAVELSQIGARIEAHYGKPQDIEWAIVEDEIFILQSRPITSLYPLPAPAPLDDGLHAYISISHAQVMTDPMSQMGISMWKLLLLFGNTNPHGYNDQVCAAGGRMYADLTSMLRHPLPQRVLPKILMVADPLIAKTLKTVIKNPDLHKGDGARMRLFSLLRWVVPLFGKGVSQAFFGRPEGTIDRLNEFINQALVAFRAEIDAAEPGVARLEVVRDLLRVGFEMMVRKLPPFLAAGMISSTILKKLAAHYGDPKDADDVVRGLSGNVTTEMDLAVGDLADIVRKSPALVTHFQTNDVIVALETAVSIRGGSQFLVAWEKFMAKYGMRGPSEIDVSRLRWKEEPSSLIQVMLGSLQNKEGGTHRKYHADLMAAGEAAGERIVTAVRPGLFGAIRAKIAKRMVRVARTHMAMREHPKYFMVQMLWTVKQIILTNAQTLVAQGRMDDVQDVWYFDLIELIDILKRPKLPIRERIAQRKAEMARFHKMVPPRVITSDGEIPTIEYDMTDLPAGALPGSSVSTGVIEGIAKVVTDPTNELLSPGEILVAPFTDPGWTPLFINAAGLVMEVGGLMTHGSVVAREYGIPAVVGVLEATHKIQTGQRIRVQGDLGYVEILE
ncbi:MAG: phosphoenolpyruvate synthase [Chloroflexi bacterium]|nr:phosphoenolpyruvate synthase [Chloroflexota bacterium]